MAAYRTAVRLFPGCHYANLYIGMEYLRMSNYKTALASLEEARRLNGEDALVFNEIGIVYYSEGRYGEARETLARALSLCIDISEDQQCAQTQTILLNLAHCHRKLQ